MIRRSLRRTLKCPSCGHSGELTGPEASFDDRGRWRATGEPVYRCKVCLAGIIVSPRQRPRAHRARLVDADTWLELGMVGSGHDTDVDAEQTAASLDLINATRELRERGATDDQIVSLVCEALAVERAEAEGLLEQ